jgi:hypothetical protein
VVVVAFLATGPGPVGYVIGRTPTLSALAIAVAVLVPAAGALVRGIV